MATARSQWADGPYPLITTIPFSKDSSHSAYYIATQMALAHNGILRGLNSIYIQASHIPASARGDFLLYCQCWCEAMHHHHDTEEDIFFPDIERICGVNGLMEKNVEQHRAFTPGFEEFQRYARTTTPQQYDGTEVKRLIEAFAESLTSHLHDEIPSLKSLDKYDSDKLREAYKRMEKAAMNADKYRIGPVVFGTSDRSFEDGLHNFPPVPFFVPYIIHYAFERKYRGAWRFNPCSTWRDRRELEFQETGRKS